MRNKSFLFAFANTLTINPEILETELKSGVESCFLVGKNVHFHFFKKKPLTQRKISCCKESVLNRRKEYPRDDLAGNLYTGYQDVKNISRISEVM